MASEYQTQTPVTSELPSLTWVTEQLEAATYDAINAWDDFKHGIRPQANGSTGQPLPADRMVRLGDLVAMIKNLATDIRQRA